MHRSPLALDRRWSRSILIALVVFLYLPVAYRSGWLVAQKATVDFPAFWYAGVLTFEQDKTPYGKHAFDEASVEMWQHVHPYIYPPPSLLVGWPLAQLPFPLARIPPNLLRGNGGPGRTRTCNQTVMSGRL